jgi:hypothetical protein
MDTRDLQWWAQGFKTKLAELRGHGSLDAINFNICCDVVQEVLKCEADHHTMLKIPQIRKPKLEGSYKLAYSDFRRIANVKKYCVENAIEYAGFFQCGDEVSLQCTSAWTINVAFSKLPTNELMYCLNITTKKPLFGISEDLNMVEATHQLVESISVQNEPVIPVGLNVVKAVSDFKPETLFYESSQSNHVYAYENDLWYLNVHTDCYQITSLQESPDFFSSVPRPLGDVREDTGLEISMLHNEDLASWENNQSSLLEHKSTQTDFGPIVYLGPNPEFFE